MQENWFFEYKSSFIDGKDDHAHPAVTITPTLQVFLNVCWKLPIKHYIFPEKHFRRQAQLQNFFTLKQDR